MDFGKTFTYVFEDPDWIKKVALGGVITLVPILNFASYGYSLEVVKRVINNDPRPLPEWDDFGGKFVKGLLYLVISFVYALPLILLACIMGVAFRWLVGLPAPLHPGAAAKQPAERLSSSRLVSVAWLFCIACS